MSILKKTIDDIVLQYSSRGMDKLRECHYENYCQVAVENFLKIEKGNIFIYTGFYVDGFAETDGPIGTYFLAKTLKRLGYTPIIITDKFCLNFFKEFQTFYIGHDDCNEKTIDIFFDKFNPVCHISIERCGKNIDGSYINAKGIDISKFTPALDVFFKKGSELRPSFAIGDGGNEIGMGNFKEYLSKNLDIKPSVVESHFTIIASVSNWGAYGFIAYLERYLEFNLLPNFEDVNAYLEYIVSLGAVDGLTNKNEMTVDGKEWYLEAEILSQLKNINIRNRA